MLTPAEIGWLTFFLVVALALACVNDAGPRTGGGAPC